MVDLKQKAVVEKFNEESLESLIWIINTSAGKFDLSFAYCNYPFLREEIVQQLKNRCSIEQLNLKKSDDTLFTQILDCTKQNQNKLPTALMVLGLESLTSLDMLLKATNFSRDSFKKNFNFPLVLWVNDLVLSHIIRQAPDFKSWANTIRFLLPAEKLITTLHQKAELLFKKILDEGSGKFVSNKDIFGQAYRVQLDSALRDLKECGQTLDKQLIANLDFVEGREKYDLILSRKDYKKKILDESLQHYQKSLEFWKKNNQQEKQAVIQYHIGLCYALQADLQQTNERLSAELLEQSKCYFQQGLKILNQLKNKDILAKFINQLPKILQQLADYYQSEEIDKYKKLLDLIKKTAEDSLELQQINQNLVLEAEALGFLAYVACQKQEWEQANDFSLKALTIIEEVKEINKMQPYLFTKAQAQWHLKQRNQAIQTLEKAKNMGLVQEQPKLYLDILERLQFYYRKKQDYLKAFRVKQKQSSIKQQFNQQVFIGPGYLSPRLSQKPEVASEIDCCPSRRKDLKELYKRITDSSGLHSLTILHGPPGVGKSSILRVGLIPELQKAQNKQDKLFIPIILSTSSGSNHYQDWLSFLEEKIAKALGNERFRSEGTERQRIESLIEYLETEVNKPRAQTKIIVLIFDDFEEFFTSQEITDSFHDLCYFFAKCLPKGLSKILISIKEDYLPYLLDLERELRENENSFIDLDILSNYSCCYRLNYLTKEDAKELIKTLTKSLKWTDNFIEYFLDTLDELTETPEQVRPLDLQLLGELLQARNITDRTSFQNYFQEEGIEKWFSAIIEECGYQEIALKLLYLLTIPEGNINISPRKTKAGLSRILELVEFGLLKQQNASSFTPKIKKLTKKDLDTHISVVLEILTGQGILIKGGFSANDTQYQLVNESLRSHIQNIAKNLLKEDICEKLGQPERAIRRTILIEEIKQLCSKADALFFDNNQLDSLLCSLDASKKFLDNQELLEEDKELKDLIVKTLKTIFYAIQERNRFTKHKGDVYCVSFSPDEKEEDQLIASGGADQTIKLWRRNGQIEKELEAPNGNGHNDWITAVCFNPDGQLIASGSADHTIKLWSRDGDLTKTLGTDEDTKYKDWVRDVCFSPDGQLIASASKVGNDKNWTIQLWEIATGKAKELNSSMRHEKRINCVTFSPDGQIIASASDDSSIKLWNLDGTIRKTFPKYSNENLDGHHGAVNSVSFHKEGKIIASASSDETIKIWDLDGNCLTTLRGHLEIVRRVRFNSNGKLLASASDDHTVKVWSFDRTLLSNEKGKPELKIGGTLLTTFEGHDDCVWDVNFSPDCKILASASEDNTVRLWDLDVVFPQNLQAHEDKIWRISFSPDNKNKFLVTGSADNTIRLWRLENGQPELYQELQGHTDWVWGINFSPDGQTMVSGGGDKTLKLWKWNDTQNKYVIFKSIVSAHLDCICCVKFSPDGKLLASASADKTLKLWNPNENYAEVKILDEHQDRVYSIDFSRDGQRIVSCSADCTLKIWSRNGEIIKSIDKGDKDDPENPGHIEWVNQASFSPNSKLIASASNDNTIKVWDCDGNHQKTIKGHRYKVWSVRFLDDETLVSVGDDKAIKFWNLDGKELKVKLKGVSNRITNIKISPEQKILAASTNHGIIQLWKLNQVKVFPLSFEKLVKHARQWSQNYRVWGLSDDTENLIHSPKNSY